MEAVIDPAGPTIVGQVPPGASRHGGPWADFVTVPVPAGLENKPLKAALIDDAWVISSDDSAILDQAWSELRARRNALLAACDWTVLADAQTQKDAWFAYRQALRDLPGTLTNPTNVTWPTPP
jgi:hypothetical protein